MGNVKCEGWIWSNYATEAGQKESLGIYTSPLFKADTVSAGFSKLSPVKDNDVFLKKFFKINAFDIQISTTGEEVIKAQHDAD